MLNQLKRDVEETGFANFDVEYIHYDRKDTRTIQVMGYVDQPDRPEQKMFSVAAKKPKTKVSTYPATHSTLFAQFPEKSTRNLDDLIDFIESEYIKSGEYKVVQKGNAHA
jgi:hypothetical protein